MTIKKNLLMITAAAFISTGAAFAQDNNSTQVAPPELPRLVDLLNSNEPLDRAAIIDALAGFKNVSVVMDGNGEVRIRFVDGNGQQWRVRIENGEIVRFRANDDGLNDTSDANGDDTSDTSDSNGGSSNSSSDSNSGSDDNSGSDSNSGSGGSSDN
jgi:hypothetical protein